MNQSQKMAVRVGEKINAAGDVDRRLAEAAAKKPNGRHERLAYNQTLAALQAEAQELMAKLAFLNKVQDELSGPSQEAFGAAVEHETLADAIASLPAGTAPVVRQYLKEYFSPRLVDTLPKDVYRGIWDAVENAAGGAK